MGDEGRGLVCRGLTKRFPGLVALEVVDLDVAPGRVVVLLGENGAGKSTLARIISGIHAPDEGYMRLGGAEFEPGSPRDAIDAGIAMIHQETNLLSQLSVGENIFLGRLPLRGALVDYVALAASAKRYLEQVGVDIDPSTKVERLSVAARQHVEIAKALSQDARVLILDEPTAALGEEEADRLFGLIDELRRKDVGFLYISHRLGEVRRVGDSIVVLRDGRRVADWDTGDVPVERLVEAMVGRSVEQVYPDPPRPREQALLRVEGLGRAGAFRDVGFVLRRGEILGIAGLAGAGRTELARALFGAEPAESGSIRLDGEAFAPRTPAHAVGAGLVLVPEDRKEQGLVLGLSVEDNVALPSLAELAEGPALRPSAVRRLTAEWTEKLRIRGRPEQPVRTLSGGNQQKVVLAKWLPRKPKVVIFDEPTRGVDVGAKAAIYKLITSLAADGTGVIVISSELPEVLGLANRVLVLSEGRQTGILERSEMSEKKVMSLAVGHGTGA
ncbi:MAG TPA: sugar ABC transporter ATP-binding protein [Actinomycetota bacterium]|nr:sugar ABC transporter ATP-binding protein [Actinomycetota bacterium]